MIYLASPIKHTDKQIVEIRVRLACRVAAEFYDSGHAVFCPASHGYHFASVTRNNVIQPWEYWRSIDIPILTRCCNELIIITLPGWESSHGVREERRIAECLGYDISYFDANDFADDSEWSALLSAIY